jgi:hypothetical protein
MHALESRSVTKAMFDFSGVTGEPPSDEKGSAL